MANLGYPIEYVRTTLRSNDANYCLAGYYLLGIDQNYWVVNSSLYNLIFICEID